VIGLQGRIPKTSAGKWFQCWMVLFTKEYFPTSFLCILLLIFLSWWIWNVRSTRTLPSHFCVCGWDTSDSATLRPMWKNKTFTVCGLGREKRKTVSVSKPRKTRNFAKTTSLHLLLKLLYKLQRFIVYDVQQKYWKWIIAAEKRWGKPSVHVQYIKAITFVTEEFVAHIQGRNVGWGFDIQRTVHRDIFL